MMPDREVEKRVVMEERVYFDLPALGSLDVAAPHFGARSGASLKRRFDRGMYPLRFLLHVTPRRVAVDIHGLLEWLRQNQAAIREGKA